MTYVFAIIFRERMVGVHGNPMPDEFGSILRAMLFLFLTGTLLDDITVPRENTLSMKTAAS